MSNFIITMYNSIFYLTSNNSNMILDYIEHCPINKFFYWFQSDIINPMTIISSVLIIIFFAFLIKALFFNGKRKFNHLKWIAATIFVIGYFIYFIGFYYSGTSRSFIAMMLRPLISSMGMFLSRSDLLGVDPLCRNSEIYMTWFALVHFSAIIVSFYTILNWAYQRVKQRLRFNKPSTLFNHTENLYIFFDSNDTAWSLAKDIHSKDEKSVTIFIDEPFENGGEGGKNEKNIIDLLGVRSFRESTQKRINSQQLNGSLFVCSKINISSEMLNTSHDIWADMDLDNLRPIMNRCKKIHLFLLSSDESDNIKAARNLLGNKDIQEENKYIIYCKAAINRVNIATVNEANKDQKCKVKLIDDSAISIDVLKKMNHVENGKNIIYPTHPINYVKINQELGTVNSQFTAMIIGCGRTGIDAMKFLYEFGAFINDIGAKSPFSCIMIDKNMNNIKGELLREIPILQQESYVKNEIEFLNCDYNSKEFVDKLTSIIDKLNYVVIATGNDELNIRIAIDLYEYIYRFRQNGIENFSIYVRNYNIANEHRMKTASLFYNENDKKNVINIFGFKQDIYTYENIIENTHDIDIANRYFLEYQKLNREEIIQSWEERHDRIANTDYNIRLKIEHQEKQDLSNVLHMYTKFKLLQKYIDCKSPDKESYKNFNKECHNSHYIQCLLNVSSIEHLRWNSSHYMAGFVYHSKDKCFRKKTHPCLIPFNSLDISTQVYDYIVVKTTIELLKRDRNE